MCVICGVLVLRSRKALPTWKIFGTRIEKYGKTSWRYGDLAVGYAVDPSWLSGS